MLIVDRPHLNELVTVLRCRQLEFARRQQHRQSAECLFRLRRLVRGAARRGIALRDWRWVLTLA